MDLSFALPISGTWATAENIVELARVADQRQCRGLWTFQRVLFPENTDMASVYQGVIDPTVLLAYAAAVTTRARLGLAVVNGPFYAPAVLAKQLIAVDLLSNGRLDAGIGLGWLPEEYAAAGVPMAGRGKRFDEWLEAFDAVLPGGQVAFSGEHYSVPASMLEPKPVQRPRPPILIGGSSEAAYRRAARYDGWIASSRASAAEVKAAIDAMRDAATTAGRDASEVRGIVRGVTALRATPVADPDRRLLHGSLEQIAEDVEKFAIAGVDELFFDLNFDSELVGNPNADAGAAKDMAYQILETLIPA